MLHGFRTFFATYVNKFLSRAGGTRRVASLPLHPFCRFRNKTFIPVLSNDLLSIRAPPPYFVIDENLKMALVNWFSNDFIELCQSSHEIFKLMYFLFVLISGTLVYLINEARLFQYSSIHEILHPALSTFISSSSFIR